MASITFDDIPDAPAGLTFDDIPDAPKALSFDDIPAATPAGPTPQELKKFEDQRRSIRGKQVSQYLAEEAGLGGFLAASTPEGVAALDATGTARAGIEATPTGVIPGSVNLKAAGRALISPVTEFTAMVGEELGIKAPPSTATEDMQTPILTFPQPSDEGVAGGLGRSASKLASGLTTPENLILLGTMAGAPAALQKVGSAVFLGMMGSAVPEQVQAIREAETPGQTAEAVGDLVGTSGMIFLGAKHLNARPATGGVAPGEVRPTSMAPEVANRAAVQNQLRTLAGDPVPLTRDVQPSSPEIIDGLVLTREKLAQDFQNLAPEVQAERQASIDDIDSQLLRMDRAEVQASEARMREREQSPPPASPEARTESRGNPPAETGSSSLFKQAQQEAAVVAPETVTDSPASGFKTSKGSTYSISEDGTTIRDKSPHPEHPGDVGIKPKSDATFYVDEDGAQKLAEVQAKGQRTTLTKLPDGTWGMKYLDGKDAGKIERRTVTKVFDSPDIGLQPVEVWADGSKPHFGNKITEVFGKTKPTSETVTPETVTEPAPMDDAMLKTYQDSAERIADQVAKGQPTIVREAARDAALDNAMSSLRGGKTPTVSFMRKSAQEAAGKAAGRQGESLEAPVGETTVGETVAAPRAAVENAEPIAKMNAAIDTALSKRDAKIVREAQEMSLEEVAKANGVSRQRVSQIVQWSLPKIKAQMEKAGITREDIDFGPSDSASVLGIANIPKPVQWLLSNIKRLFTAEGHLPREVFERNINRDAEIKGITKEITYTVRDLYNAVQKELGISNLERFKSGLSTAPRALVKQMNDTLLGQSDINLLPEGLRAPIQSMREQIDILSKRMIDEGLIDQDLQAKVADNLGTYMTRSYRIFDDPKWAEKIPQTTRNKAHSFLLSELRKADPAKTEVDANRLMAELLEDWRAQNGKGQGSRLGAMDLSSFIKRKDIVPEIRELMGEYENPAVNYARSVSKMANLIGNQRFLQDVRQMGLGKFLFEEGTEPSGFSTKLAAEGSDAMSPLNGLRTSPEIAEAFQTFNKSTSSDNPFFRAYMAFTSVAKGAKTVGSLMTQARNILGQPFFWAMNGHFDMRPLKKAVLGTSADLGAISDTKWRDYYRKMVDLGIVDQSTKANELRDTLRDAGLKDIGTQDEFGSGALATNLRKATLGTAERAYQLSDDLGKMVGFENEVARLKKINPEWKTEQVETEAAKRIRNIYPTYSMVPEWVKLSRRQPVFGPFMTFAYETFRTSANALKLTAEELRSPNPEARKAGAQRLAGQLAVLAGGYGLSDVSRSLVGLNADEADDARRFLPEWDANSQLLFTGKGDGKVEYVNMSYANPYSYLTDPVTAFVNGAQSDDDIAKSTALAFTELLSPFVGENILAGAAADILRNKRGSNGAPLWSSQDTFEDKSKAAFDRIGEALEPGTITRLRTKIIPSIKGEVTPSGRILSPAQEIGSELTGVKKQTMDYRQALGFKSSRFDRESQDAENIFRNVALRRGTVAESDILSSYNRAEEARFKVWSELRKDSIAAMRRGVSKNEVRKILEERNIGKQVAADILSGKYRPYRPTPESAKKAGRKLPPLVSPRAGQRLPD